MFMTLRTVILLLLTWNSFGQDWQVEIYPMAEIKKMNEAPFLFLSDNQFNNYLMDPNIIRNTIFDSFNPVAIRPPQLDLFAPDMLSWVLDKYAANKHLIHLGDALNVACQNEWKLHVEKMNPIQFGKKVHKGWVMLPGNHDAFYYGNTAGNTYFKRGFVTGSWKDTCNSKTYPPKNDVDIKDVVMSKDIFTKKYYAELLNQGKIFPEDFPNLKDVQCIPTKKATRNKFREKRTKLMICDWQAKKPNSYLQKIKFTYPIEQDFRVAYRSYFVQELNLGKIPGTNQKLKGILLDTSDYITAPRSLAGALGTLRKFSVFGSYNAGLMGNIADNQAEAVKSWLINDSDDSLVLFMGHHPYLNLSPATQKHFKEFQKLAKKSIYISSHTHTGFTINSEPVKEVNIGSITDFPNEFVSLYFKKEDDKLILFPNRVRETFSDISPDGFCAKSDNYTKRGDPKYRYMSYKKESKADPNSVYDFTLDTLINSIHRSYEKLGIYKKILNPTLLKFYNFNKNLKACKKDKVNCRSKKFKMVKAVLEFDKTLYESKKYRNNRIRYGACQSLWAAYAEYLKDWEQVKYEL
jgi:hypothetical protein